MKNKCPIEKRFLILHPGTLSGIGIDFTEFEPLEITCKVLCVCKSFW